MALHQQSSASGRHWADHLLTAPYLGWLIFATILLYKPVAHTALVLQHHYFTGPERYLVGFVIGLIGITIVAKGLRRDDVTATAMGWLGGALIWMGWFEYSFEFFADALQLTALKDPIGGFDVIPANLLVLQSTLVPFLALLILLGANRETRCRLLMWFHRNLKIAPPKPTVGYRRNYAWVTALETIFITWAFYLQILLLYDPRLFGLHHWVTYTAFGAYLIWGAYLVPRLLKHSEAGAAIRYAIPTTNVFWIAIEMGSHWQLWTEIWVKPFVYPISCIAFGAAFLGGAVLTLRARQTSGGLSAQPAE